ncbi:MAG: thioredoxin family protein [Thermoanaerobaculia bacterium]
MPRRVSRSLFALLVLAATAAAGSSEGPFLFGADGWQEAMRRADESGKAVFVYFYTDWCPYCRQFDAELVAAPEVEAYLREDVVAVRINPEAGGAEAELARRYSVRGYPALFVHPRGALDRLHGLRRTENGPSGPVLKSPAQFLRDLSRLAG